MVLTAYCTDRCQSDLDPQLYVHWRLFVGGDTANDAFTAVPDITDISKGKMSVLLFTPPLGGIVTPSQFRLSSSCQ